VQQNDGDVDSMNEGECGKPLSKRPKRNNDYCDDVKIFSHHFG